MASSRGEPPRKRPTMTAPSTGRTRWMQLRADRRGITAMEYALIAFVIGLVILTGATSLGSAVNAKFAPVTNSPGLAR